MISKERLQKLIKQEATIWADDYGEIQLCEKSEVCRVISCEGESYCLSGFIYDCEFFPFAVIPEELEEDIIYRRGSKKGEEGYQEPFLLIYDGYIE